MKKFFALLLALAMILALSACGEKQQEPSNEGDEQDNTPAQTFNFKVSITQASTDPLATYTQQWMDEVTEKTNGAVTFEFHPNGELGTINDVCEQISRGASIIAYAGPDAFMATAPDLAILNSQYCLTDASQIDLINDSDWFKGQVDNLAANGNARILSWNYFTGYYGEQVLKGERTEKFVYEHLVKEPILLRTGDGFEEYIVGEDPLVYYSTRQLRFEKKAEDDTTGKFHVLALVDGEKVIVRSKKDPDLCYTMNFLDLVVVPADMGEYEIVNLSNQPVVVYKVLVR